MNKTSLWLVLGVVFIIGGVLALFNPFAASIAVETLAGCIFLLGGCLQLFSLLSSINKSENWASAICALICIVIGVFLLANPLQGIVTLTIMLGLFFLIGGLLKIFTSSALKGTPFYVPILLSALVSLVLGVVILVFASEFKGILGLFLGLELLSNGVMAVALSLGSKNHNILK